MLGQSENNVGYFIGIFIKNTDQLPSQPPHPVPCTKIPFVLQDEQRHKEPNFEGLDLANRRFNPLNLGLLFRHPSCTDVISRSNKYLSFKFF